MNTKRAKLLNKEENIFLIGMMGSGKTTIGKLLATTLNRKFTDLDRYIEKTAGQSITDIFSEKGEEYFRNLERRVLLTAGKEARIVMACGGGTPCHATNMAFLKQHGLVLHLKVPTEILAHRLENTQSNRPLLIKRNREPTLEAYISRLLSQRETCYASAHYTVDADKTPDQVINKILAILERRRSDNP